MPQLSFDLHVHPGPSVMVPRWGTITEVRAAAARAGVRGLVWKSHEQHTAAQVATLDSQGPLVIGSASMNAFSTAADVTAAMAAGARWVWGPSRRPDGGMGWDLPLPDWWPTLRAALDVPHAMVVLGTGHTDSPGRRALAEAAHATGDICSVTHALRLSDVELQQLVALGCVLEVDLYTGTHQVPGLPPIDLAAGMTRLAARDLPFYLTSDAGQAETGDPYRFSAEVLAALSQRVGAPLVTEAAVVGPERIVARLGLC